MTKKNWINTVMFIIVGAIILGVYGSLKKSDLDNNRIYTTGRIYNYFEDTKGHHNIEFEYFIYNIRFTNSKVGGVYLFTDCERTKSCIGKCFEVEYSSKNPKNSRMNFNKPCDCDSLIIQQGVVITADKE